MNLLMNARFYITHDIRGSLLFKLIFVYLCNDYIQMQKFVCIHIVICILIIDIVYVLFDYTKKKQLVYRGF